MAEQPYTDADVELVGHAIYLDDWPDPHIDGWAGSAMSEEYRQNARAALDALAAAGRLGRRRTPCYRTNPTRLTEGEQR